ncbi:MAG: aminomethyl-transferring glycine dehydrogenase subunit GcvPA [Coriobacteriia bacterium]|nr:aminomethyl-transferring glycine dehydrogenase subunit GcvPA [Coriobacteriia bacterium]MBN2821808.1 aminomethyl-transferring glycine dehydrogenase subunit GcvPA [Coriobacteriia bacterium]
MRFIPVSCTERDEMLETVGAQSADALFDVIPGNVRFSDSLDIAGGMGELELSAHLEDLAGRNKHAGNLVSFLGGGCYDHYVPAMVDAVLSKPEFFTAYTPYQPEVSQGTLQAIYEFQTMVCSLTGMDVANASLYDGATAMVEAALMAARVKKRRSFVVAGTVHPEWRETLATYSHAGSYEVVETPASDGTVDLSALAASVGDRTAAVLVSSPNFYGNIEDLAALARIAHDAGALLVVSANPILLGVIEAPGAYGADIVVGEGQPLGNVMSFGGPGLGLFACREEFLRAMPGRIVGRTNDVDGRPGFVLTMATREQHIRRQKATSNICSNHALNALAAGVYLASVGAAGLAGVGAACISKAHFLQESLLATGKFTSPWDAPFGNEFALRYEGDVATLQSAMLERGYLAGLDLARFDASDSGLVLFAVTEKRTRVQMERFVQEVTSL